MVARPLRGLGPLSSKTLSLIQEILKEVLWVEAQFVLFLIYNLPLDLIWFLGSLFVSGSGLCFVLIDYEELQEVK